jgi:hypothetical protein
MRAKEYPLLCQAVETGVTRGWNRAHKHDPEPADDRIMEAIVEAVTLEICEAFEFEDVPREG